MQNNLGYCKEKPAEIWTPRVRGYSIRIVKPLDSQIEVRWMGIRASDTDVEDSKRSGSAKGLCFNLPSRVSDR